MIIYLAAPYSNDDPAICEQRFQDVNKKAAELMSQGHIVFSPISHSHPIAHAGELNALDSDFWCKQDLHFMPLCDELWILKLDGWGDSIGITKEIKEAERLGKKVEYID